MNTDREKLINWIRNTYVSNLSYTYKATVDDTADAVIADMLIDNGIVVREKGEWIPYFDGDSIMPERYFQCSNCGSRGWIKTRNFCPNCGADMRKGKNK